MEWLYRPLNRVPSIKVKLSVVIVAAIGVTVLASTYGWYTGLRRRWTVLIATLVALAIIQLLARGMTKPLRQMATATREMATGDYSTRVPADGADEVGQLGRAFNSLAADLEDLERQRRELIANVSHELRTPLTAIHGQLENMADGITAPSGEVFNAMLAQTERLSALVTDLLSISRLEAGEVVLHRGEVNLADLLHDVAASSCLGQADPSVEVEVAQTLSLEADADRLRQVFRNLVDNARRFSPVGQPVNVRASQVNGTVQVTVQDAGPGIPADQRTRVFERFHRVDTDRSTQTGGSGLGLAIAKSIVDAHGGSIRADEAEPNGCRMVVTLPLRFATTQLSRPVTH